jgi:hypothetical protein
MTSARRLWESHEAKSSFHEPNGGDDRSCVLEKIILRDAKAPVFFSFPSEFDFCAMDAQACPGRVFSPGLKTGLKWSLVVFVSLGVLYREAAMRVSYAAVGALLGLPAFAEVIPRQSNTNQTQKLV